MFRLNRNDLVKNICHKLAPVKSEGAAYAPANIALCKYWGKRDRELNLPATPSLSISLGNLGTHTRISPNSDADMVLLDEHPAPPAFEDRLLKFLDLFREPGQYFKVETRNTIPTAAGLASSASGFAALVLALNDLAGWDLNSRELSVLARIGSGSACRSIYDGFVLWRRGDRDDGLDSFAERLDVEWPGLCIGVVNISHAQKSIGSTQAMNRTTETSLFYKVWPERVDGDIRGMLQALETHDFDDLGRIAESNALAMHATMIESWPPVLYWQPETVNTLHKVWALRQAGLSVYLTMDAGPNVKLLFLEENIADVDKAFNGITIIKPFGKI